MKKITKIFIIFSFLLVFCTATVFAKDDVSDYKYEEDTRLIIGMGIMNGYEDGTFRPDNAITRAEFVTLLMRTLGWDGTYDGSSVFSDMDGHWAIGYINQANAIKIAYGNDDGTFDPNAQVSCQEAIAFLSNAMGYAEVAKQKGGYPQGYISIGSEIGLLKGVPVAYDAPLTRGEVTKFLSNALDAKTLEMQFSSNQISYQRGSTLLKCIGYTVYKGTVTSAWGGSLGGTKPENKYNIYLDGKRYKTSFDNGIDYLGMTVEAYIYDVGGNDEEIRYLNVDNNTQKVTVYTEDIGTVTIGTSVKYSDGETSNTIKLSPTFVVIKNGDMLTSSEMTASVFNYNEGKVTFVDSDGDRLYDYAIAWSYDEFVVKRLADNKIYCEYNRVVDLSNIDDDVELTVFYNGEAISFDEIKEGDVIAVAKNSSETKIRIDVTRNKKYATITGGGMNDYKNQGITRYFKVDSADEEVYYFSYIYGQEYANNRSYFTKPEMKDSGVMYLNEKNEIVLFSVGASINEDDEEVTESEQKKVKYKYGYLKEISFKDHDQILKIEVLTEGNIFKKFEVIEKLKFGSYEGGSYALRKKDVQDIFDDYSSTSPQIVKYSIDEEGKLTEFYLSENGANSAFWGAKGDFKTRDFANFQLEQQYVVDSTSICFYIPVSTTDDVWRASKAVTMLKSGSSYRVSLYDIVDGNVGTILYSPTLSNTRYKYILDYVNSPVMLIDKVFEAYDSEEEEIVKVIEGWQNGEYKKVAVSNTLENNSDVATNLKKGMLIQYLLNTEMRSFARNIDLPEEIILFNSICDFNNLGSDFITWDYTSLTDNNARIKVYKGTVDYIDNDNFYVTIDGDVYVASVHGGTKIMRYKQDERTVVQGTIEDIAIGSKVVVRQRYNNTREVFILE